MHKLMFVCHGNICRSPMAEFVMKKMVSDAGKEKDYSISSCATSTEEIWGGIGNPIHPEAKSEMRKHGIPFSERRAVLLRKEDYSRFDLFIGMDERNRRGMMRIFGSDPEKKVVLLTDYSFPGHEVDDPWYSGDFSAAFADIEAGCRGLLKRFAGQTEKV